MVGRYARLLNEAVLGADTARNLLILRTNPGLASAVGAALDALGLTGLVGTLAGDDTVFCAFKQDEDAIAAIDELKGKITTGLDAVTSKRGKRRRDAESAESDEV